MILFRFLLKPIKFSQCSIFLNPLVNVLSKYLKMWWHIIAVILCSCCILEHECLLYPISDPIKLYNYTPPEDQVTFYLYHHSDLSTADQLFVDDKESIYLSRYDSKLDTKFIIHGWTHGKDVPWVKEMREAMANRKQWNIIVVDWAPLSHVIYIEARIHCPVVSKQLAQMLLTLKRYKGLNFSTLHLIGHSMGAQIAAYSSIKVSRIINETISRITGLDPAAPLFEWPHMEYLDEVLDPTDADFVDVIHTNGRYLGMITPAGHVDYYPNGGEQQPGCVFWICSHIRAVEFWTVSIKNPTQYMAIPYDQWNDYTEGRRTQIKSYPMGILSSQQIPSGTYFLETGDELKLYLSTSTTLMDSYL